MARFPTGPFDTHRTGCFGCVRQTPADGSCGIGGFPCQHFGLDLFATSPQVFAPEDGTVIDVADGSAAPFVGFGPGVIVIQGDSGFFHLLGHLSFNTIKVQQGQRVVEGQPLATFDPGIGHTHWEVRQQRLGSTPPNTIDPNIWLQQEQALDAAAVPEEEPSGAGKFFVGLLVVGGLVGLSWLALRAAKRVAVANPF